MIYPWYLLFFTPFLLTTSTLPLTVWTWTVLPVYLVWEWAQSGARWQVPGWLMTAEYGAVSLAVLFLMIRLRTMAPAVVSEQQAVEARP